MKTVAGVLKTFTKAVKHLEQIEREQTQRMVALTTALTDATREQQAAISIRRNINALKILYHDRQSKREQRRVEGTE